MAPYAGVRAPGTPAHDSGPAEARRAKRAGRIDLEVRQANRACKDLVESVAASQETHDQALHELFRDMSAASCRPTSRSLWTKWVHVHMQWFGMDVDALPLTQDIIFAIAACFKKGVYNAWPAFASKANGHHILSGFPWDAQLGLAVRKASASVMRGVGVARHSGPFDILQALRILREGKGPAQQEAPLGWHVLRHEGD